jgi:hypothetical protein
MIISIVKLHPPIVVVLQLGSDSVLSGCLSDVQRSQLDYYNEKDSGYECAG